MSAPATATATATAPEDRVCEACPCPNPSLTRWRCPDCDVSWRRDLGGWFVLDMECGCGARAHSDWTWVEWYSDTVCGTCHSERSDHT